MWPGSRVVVITYIFIFQKGKTDDVPTKNECFSDITLKTKIFMTAIVVSESPYSEHFLNYVLFYFYCSWVLVCVCMLVVPGLRSNNLILCQKFRV